MSQIRNFSLFRESETSTPDEGDKLSNLSNLGIFPPSWTWEEIKKAYKELIEEIEWDDLIEFDYDNVDWSDDVQTHTYGNQITFEIEAKPSNGNLSIDLNESGFYNLFEEKLNDTDSEARIGGESWGFESIKRSFEEAGWDELVKKNISEFQESEDCWIDITSEHRYWTDGNCEVTFEFEMNVDYDEVKNVIIDSASDFLDDVEYELKKK